MEEFNDILNIRRLEIGSGENPTPGYEHLDIRPLPGINVVADARDIPIDDNIYDEILAVNILEHFNRNETVVVLKEWRRVLKPSGKITVLVPNIIGIFAAFIAEQDADEEFIERLYGTQDYPENYHYNGFTKKTLAKALQDAGFINININWITFDLLQVEGFK